MRAVLPLFFRERGESEGGRGGGAAHTRARRRPGDRAGALGSSSPSSGPPTSFRPAATRAQYTRRNCAPAPRRVSAAANGTADALGGNISATTVPDLYRSGHPSELYELKCYAYASSSNTLVGRGSAATGGAPSTVDGGRYAFGNTEERLRRLVLGLDGHGQPGEAPLNRHTGRGWVRATTGSYTDALRKGHHVTLLVAENSGALAPGFRDLLRLYGRVAGRPYAHDATVYGTARTSPRAYYAHHLAAISAAIVALVVLAALTPAAGRPLCSG